MRAVTFANYGPPEVLRLGEVPTPQVDRGDVLVRIVSAGVCRHDVLHRAGKLPGSPAGAILGHEIAGYVEQIGPEVTSIKSGDRVVVFHKLVCGVCDSCIDGRVDLCRSQKRLGTDASGGYAECIVVPQQNVIGIPDNVSMNAAALAVCPMGASLRALRAAGAELGMTVAIVGAAGGLGVHQVQLASSMGLRVIAITRSAKWSDQLAELGAEMSLIAPEGDFARQVKSVTGGEGVDIVLDNVISSTFEASLRSLGLGGVCVVLGNLEVRDIQVRPGLLIYRRLRIVGSGTPTKRDVRDVLTLLAMGKVKPVIAEELPLSMAAMAHEWIERGGRFGRFVLHPEDAMVS